MLTLYQDLTMTHCTIKKHPRSQLLPLTLYFTEELLPLSPQLANLKQEKNFNLKNISNISHCLEEIPLRSLDWTAELPQSFLVPLFLVLLVPL